MGSNEQSGVDVDREIEQAWAEFERDLTARLQAMTDDRIILLQTMGDEPEDGALPYLQVAAFGDGDFRRCEVSSDDVLAPGARLGSAGAVTLTDLGFLDPDDDPDEDGPNWYVYAEAKDCEALAGVAIRVLREAFGVVHPLLLAGMPSGPDGTEIVAPRTHGADLEPVDLDGAYQVTQERQLAALVDRTFATITDAGIARDDDGDWPIALDRGTAWVRLLHSEPTLRIFGTLVHDIRHPRAATREVAILNRDATLLRYTLTSDRLFAELDLCASPYVPRHLMEAIGRFRNAAGQSAEDFAARTGGVV